MQDVERIYGKLELECLLERDDIKVNQEARLHLQGKEVIMEKKVANKSKDKLQQENRRMAENHALAVETDVNSGTLASLQSWGSNLKIAV